MSFRIRFKDGEERSFNSLVGADLREANLSGANLREANLRGADLREANLSGANLSRANLKGADLSGANLSRANLKGANLRGADLSFADLSFADLGKANLRGADLREANLSGANLKGANLRNCRHSLEVLSSVSGLEWDVVCKNDLVGVGCQEHLLSKWLEFSEEEIREMDSKALDFYPFLISMLQNIYKDSVYSEVLGRRL